MRGSDTASERMEAKNGRNLSAARTARERIIQTAAADFAFCNIRMDNMRDGSSVEKSNPRISGGEFTEKKHRQFLTTYVAYFTTFLFRRSFLDDNALRFPGTRSSEDSAFLAACILL